MTLVATRSGGYVRDDDPGEIGYGVGLTRGEPRVSVSDREADLLAFLALGRTVVEIGTGLGVATKAMAACADKVHTVDNDPWVARHVFPHFNSTAKVTTYTRRPGVRADMVFIDGLHLPGAIRDDVAYARTVCPKGVIVARGTRAQQVSRALLECDPAWQFVMTDHGVGILHVGWEREP